MSGWGSKGHTSQGNRQYNPDTAQWDYAPVRENADGSQQHPAFFTDAGKAVFTNPAPAALAAGGTGNGGAGPGSTGAGGPGGSGPGSTGVVARPKQGSQLTLGEPLKPNLKPTVTQVKVGGDWWQSNPWFSDADEWTARYGEGEIAETFFFLTNVTADTFHNTWRLGNHLGTEYAGPGVYQTQSWFEDAPRRVSGPMPVQEPVDWGR